MEMNIIGEEIRWKQGLLAGKKKRKKKPACFLVLAG